MNAVNPCCSNCGFLLDADCDFCPSCGAVKGKPNPTPPRVTDPHGWMNDSASPASPPRVSAPLAAPSIQVQPVSYVTSAVASNLQDSGLATTVRTMGIVAISFMAVALIPCLGWLNYLNLTLSFITLVLSIVSLASAKSDAARSSALVGLLLVIIAGFVGVFRLILGGGCV
jgi:hypothetical protein